MSDLVLDVHKTHEYELLISLQNNSQVKTSNVIWAGFEVELQC